MSRSTPLARAAFLTTSGFSRMKRLSSMSHINHLVETKLLDVLLVSNITSRTAPARALESRQGLGLWPRGEVESGAGQEPGDQTWTVLDAFESGLDQGEELIDAAFGQVGQALLQMRPDCLDRVEFGRVRRLLVDVQPRPGRDQPAHPRADVGVEAVPDQQDQ